MSHDDYTPEQRAVIRDHYAQLSKELFVGQFFGAHPPDEPEPTQKPMGFIEFIEKANTANPWPITAEDFDKAMQYRPRRRK